MSRFINKTSKKAGLPPGTLVYVGEGREEKVNITIIDYDKNRFEERNAEKVEECLPFKDKPTVTWINIDGIHQVAVIDEMGKHFDIHPLILEDIVNTNQRPKMEEIGDYIFVVFKMIYYDEKENEIKAEQVSLVLGSNYVISFQEREGDVFDPIRERIRGGNGRIRKMGSDYLAYALIDAVVDNYFVILERIGEKLEDLEEELLINPTPEILWKIHSLKRDMIFLRKSVWPFREIVDRFERGESKLVQKSTRIYLRDVYDHTIQVIDAIETSRDMLSGMLDIYLSSVNNRMNEIMKVLTIVATIFIPLTFIAGVYGMNFQYMPELKWRWGYLGVSLVMVAVSSTMLMYFRRKKWL